MNRRSFIKTACLATTSLLFSHHCAFAAPAPPGDNPARRPNIIFIFADDWGWGDLSCHGNKLYKTPNLDKMAQQGIDFTQFNVSNPVCSPSRTAVMTGHFPARHSIHQHFDVPDRNKRRGMPDWLDPKVVQMPRLFREAGYKTGHFGKWHLTNTGCDGAPLPTAYGYDESAVFNGPGPQISAADSSTFDKTIEFIRKHKDSPFFLNVWIHQTHTPHWPKQQFLEDYKNLAEQHRVYAAIVAEGDHGVGQIMQALDDLDLAGNTLVAFSSDNGPEHTGGRKQLDTGMGTYYSVGSTAGLKGRKRSLFEGGVRTPFIVRWPGKAPAGETNDTTVITGADLLPTFCQAAGIALPPDYKPDGESLLDAFLGKDIRRTKPIFWEWKGGGSGDLWPGLGIRDGDWKLVMTHDGKRRELYHVPKDRMEKNNVADANGAIVEKLSEMVLQWKKSLPKEPSSDCISPLRK